MPAMMLSAFASELYLKCLHRIDSGIVPDYGHDLGKLYKNLPELRRSRIEQLWNFHTQETGTLRAIAEKVGVDIPLELTQALKDGALGFQKLRYEYEDSSFKFYISELPLMLHRTILEIQPTWRRNRPDPSEGFEKLRPND